MIELIQLMPRGLIEFCHWLMRAFHSCPEMSTAPKARRRSHGAFGRATRECIQKPLPQKRTFMLPALNEVGSGPRAFFVSPRGATLEREDTGRSSLSRWTA